MESKFKQIIEAAKSGEMTLPSVSMNGVQVDYLEYQIIVHSFNLKLMATGLKVRGVTFTQIKKFYGLRARSAADAVPELESVKSTYKNNK